MALLRYFTKRTVLPNEEQCTSLSRKELKEANKRDVICLKETYKDNASANGVANSRRGQYNEYTSEQRAQIGKYNCISIFYITLFNSTFQLFAKYRSPNSFMYIYMVTSHTTSNLVSILLSREFMWRYIVHAVPPTVN